MSSKKFTTAQKLNVVILPFRSQKFPLVFVKNLKREVGQIG
jgi:hypothetical protein